jgi:hypothetical protein
VNREVVEGEQEGKEAEVSIERRRRSRRRRRHAARL